MTAERRGDRRARRARRLFPVVMLLSAAPAAAQSDLQITPDGGRTLISKDFGAERWAITLNARYPSAGLVPGRGTIPPGYWEHDAFIKSILDSIVE